jgi:hypothetical protein
MTVVVRVRAHVCLVVFFFVVAFVARQSEPVPANGLQFVRVRVFCTDRVL